MGISTMKTSMPSVVLFSSLDNNQRRWVEFNDYLNSHSHSGDMVPPKWHGWLSHQYDDVPKPDGDSFHDPFFEQPHDWNPSSSATRIHTSMNASIHPMRVDFKNYRMGRYAKEWEATTKRQ